MVFKLAVILTSLALGNGSANSLLPFTIGSWAVDLYFVLEQFKL